MDATEKRINRIVGQLKGIERMVKEKRDCAQILQQISAVKKAIDAITKEIVVADVCENMSPEKTKRAEEIIARAISL